LSVYATEWCPWSGIDVAAVGAYAGVVAEAVRAGMALDAGGGTGGHRGAGPGRGQRAAARPRGSVAAYRGRPGPRGGAGRPAGPDRGHRDRAGALPAAEARAAHAEAALEARPGRGQPEGRWGGWAAGQPPWTAPQLVIAQRLAAGGGRPELLARHSICQISRAGGLRLAAKVRLSRSGCVVDGAGALRAWLAPAR
jgi:hypothetical protein